MQWFRSIEFVERLPRGGPATVNRKTGHLKLSLEYWDRIEKEYKVFILLHELGHYVLQSGDELEVDRWAMNHYMRMGYSLKKAIQALTRVLSFTNAEHYERVNQQLDLAMEFDLTKNGNQKVLKWKKKN